MDNTLDSFTFELSSKIPTPGGGGAAALCAALSASLGAMTANYTMGKKKYAEYDAEMEDIISESDSLRKEALHLIAADAEAFEPLSIAYSIPKDEPGRDEHLEHCLHEAASVPMRIARLAYRCSDIADTLEKHGSALMVSDAGCCAIFASAALEAAALNVFVNTRLMKDRELAEKLNSELNEMLEKLPDTAKRVAKRLS